MQTSRNAPCHCGSGNKYKKCCLEKDEAQRKPHTGQDAVIVLMPTRGQICVETQMAIENNMGDVQRSLIRIGHKPIVEARNSLARFALQCKRENPFAFTPREWFALWCDDDAWFPPGLPAMMLRCMHEHPAMDALFGYFGRRVPYSSVCAWRRRRDPESSPKLGVDCDHGDIIEIAEAGFHFVMMRMALLERLGENPFDVTDEDKSEDIAFCNRAKTIGARLAVCTGFPVLHIDPRDGIAYQPGMPAMMMEGNSVQRMTLEHAAPDGMIKTGETRAYGGSLDSFAQSMEQNTAREIQAKLESRRKVSDAA